MTSVLSEINCPTHFSRFRHASCTALNLDRKLDSIEPDQNYNFPIFLFDAEKLLISKLHKDNQFEILATINLKQPKQKSS